MVRKTTAVDVTNTNKQSEKNSKASSHTASDNGFDIEKFLTDAFNWAKENSHLLIGIVFLLLWLVVLKEFLLGMVLVTAGILFVSGFFKNRK